MGVRLSGFKSRLRHHNDGRRRNLKRLRLFCFGRVRMGLNDAEILRSWLKGIFEAIEVLKVAGLQLQEFHDKILSGVMPNYE